MKHALRSLLKSPGFTVIALLTLALGIGVNTSMFTIVNTLLFQQVPFVQPEQLVRVFRTSPQSQRWPHAIANYLDLKNQNRSFTSLAAYVNNSSSYTPAAGQAPERLRTITATGEFFPLLGIPAALGRTFTVDDARPGSAKVVVLSHELWVSRFGADPSVVGRELRIDGALATVVGVMPEGFVPRLVWGPVQLFRPFVFSAKDEQTRDHNYITVIGRIAPGIALTAAETELRALADRLAEQYPLTNAGSSIRLVPLAQSSSDNTARTTSWFVFGLAGFVLLIACANLANLQISRAAARAREYAIRLALGASRWRIMRALLAESALLGLTGGALGLLIAVWTNDVLGRQLVVGPAIGLELPVDPVVFSFAVGISLFAVFASGLLPAWLASRATVGDALKVGGRGIIAGGAHQNLRHALIIGEVALALMLLGGAGVFIRGLQRFTAQDPGWRPDHLLTADLVLPASKYSDADARRAFFQKLDDALVASPLFEHASISGSMPIGHYDSSTSFVVEGRPPPRVGSEPLANIVHVTPGFLDTIGLRLIRGRWFNAHDRSDRPGVIVINEAMAHALFPNEDPVGRRIGDPGPDQPQWFEIVGVVSNVGAPAELSPPDTRFQTYRPLTQDSFPFASIAVRGQLPADQLGAELQRLVAAIDPDQPVHNIHTARTEITQSLSNVTIISRLLGGFAILGLALAAIGIYGVLANYVAQRTQEIGVRIALGAQLRDILRLVLGHGLRLAALGAVLGFFGAFGLAQLLSRLLPALGSPEPMTFVAIVLVLLAVAWLACWLPARRATRVDPMTALRAE